MEWADTVLALHKCGIQRPRISELLKPLNITRVVVHRTVELNLGTGGVSDRKRAGSLAWFVRHRLLTLSYQELTEILPENKNSWLGKWTLRREP